MEQYNEGLRIARSIAVTYPSAVATQKNRIAQVFSARNQPGDKQAALDEYREALKLLEQELDGNPSDAYAYIEHSVNAPSHRRPTTEMKTPMKLSANLKLQLRQEGSSIDVTQGDADWRIGLVTDNTRLGDVLFQKKKNWQGLRNYNEAVQIVEAIILNNPTSTRWESSLAALNAKRGDVLFDQGEYRLKNPDPPEAASSRFMGNALERYRDAAQEL